MPKKLTIEDMRKLARSRGGECISRKYVGTRRKLRWRCAKGHEWNATLHDVKYRGSWCPECHHSSRRLKLEDLRELAQSRGGECLSGEYVNAMQKLRWRCAKGHEWKAMAHGVKYTGSWCPKCHRSSRRLKMEDLRELAKTRGGECLSKEYKNIYTKLKWRCAKGHEWKATVSGIKHAGSWCPECGRGRRTGTVKRRRGGRKTVRRTVPKDDTSGIKDVYIDKSGQIIVM